jgi:flagellar hook protein FlgE
MLRSLTSAVSGLQSFQGQMDIIGNNIANVNTTGFKGSRTEFADAFSQTLRGSSAATTTVSGQTAMQVGTGVSTGAIQTLFTQGAVSRTGVGSDMAIAGEGFFIVKDPVSGDVFATRDGSFHVDSNNFLVTATGLRVQGQNYGGGSTTGVYDDIVIDNDGNTSEMKSWTVNTDGTISVSLADGNVIAKRDQILTQKFADPQALMKQGNNLYSALANASPVGAPAIPGTSGLGSIVGGALELSNVDLASEFSNLIITQRAFQATSKIITTSDEILQELVNLKR